MPEAKTCLDCIDVFDQCARELQTLRALFYYVDVFARRDLSAMEGVEEAAALRIFRNQADTCFNALELIDRLAGDVVESLRNASDRAYNAMKGVKTA